MQVFGTTYARDYVVDSRHGLVPQPIRGLAERLVPRLPALRPLVYEVRPESFASLTRSRARRAARLADERVGDARLGRRPAGCRTVARRAYVAPFNDARVRVGAWERDIVARIATPSANEPDGSACEQFATLTAAAREAAIAESAELSLRLLAATVGRGELADLLRRYCAQTFAETLPANEGATLFAIRRT